MTEEKQQLVFPESGPLDQSYALLKAALGCAGPVGGLMAEAFSQLIEPPLEKRREQFLRSLGERLVSLEDSQKLTIKDLPKNEAFVTTLVHATQAAQRTHESNKREALRNAVLNATLPGAPSDAMQHIYVRLIDEFTDWHLRVLTLLDEPRIWFGKVNGQPTSITTTGSILKVIYQVFPELRGQQPFVELIVGSLNNAGLSQVSGLAAIMSAGDALERRTTEHGHEFIKFITDPL